MSAEHPHPSRTSLFDRLRRLLVRETSSGGFIPEIDGLRFVAITSVVLYHLTHFYLVKSGRSGDGIVTRVLLQGGFGVNLFFVISGFIISLPFAKFHLAGEARPDRKRFYFRRLTRLEPPYFVNLVVMFAALAVIKGGPIATELPHLLASAAYQHNVIYGSASSINFVAWSLEIEFQFYVLAPLLVNVLAIRGPLRRRVILILAILAASALTLITRGSPRLYLSIAHNLGYFLAGFLLADLYVTGWSSAAPRRAWDGVTLVAWPAILVILLRGGTGRLVLPLLVAAAYAAALRGQWTRALFRRPVLYVVGGMCYTTYLYHFAIISAVGNPLLRFVPSRLPVALSVGILGLAVVPIVLLASTVLYVAIERPFMGRRALGRAPALEVYPSVSR